MKKLTILIILLLNTALIFGQAKKPILMVVPSDNWCIEHGFSQQISDQGTTITVPDYRAALQNSTEMLMAIGKINSMMAERGFPLKNLESTLKSLQTTNAERAMLTSRSGSSISESPIDVLKRTAQADIWLQLSYQVNKTGPNQSISYMLQALDAYTNKQVAGVQGTGDPSYSVELTLLLEEAIIGHMDDFTARLQDHFMDIFQNGREITFSVLVWDTSPVDLEEEYDYRSEYLLLGEIIEDWVADNTMQGRYSLMTYTENQLVFEQVRIPLYDDRGRAMDTRRWIRSLASELRQPPLSLSYKIHTRGLGEVWIIIGE